MLTNADILLVARAAMQHNMTLVAEMAALVAKEADVQEKWNSVGTGSNPGGNSCTSSTLKEKEAIEDANLQR